MVAVTVITIHLDRIDTVQALFGQERWIVRTGQRDAEPGPRKSNGVWCGPDGPQNTRVGAVLIANEVLPWTVASSDVCLIHNPWAAAPVAGPICAVAQGVPDGDTMQWLEGVHPRGIFDLPEGWPGLMI